MVSEVPQVKGLIVASGCQVGGIFASPGIGDIVADIISGQKSLLPNARFQVDRFGGEYADDTHLRSRCEQVYACHYWDMY